MSDYCSQSPCFPQMFTGKESYKQCSFLNWTIPIPQWWMGMEVQSFVTAGSTKHFLTSEHWLFPSCQSHSTCLDEKTQHTAGPSSAVNGTVMKRTRLVHIISTQTCQTGNLVVDWTRPSPMITNLLKGGSQWSLFQTVAKQVDQAETHEICSGQFPSRNWNKLRRWFGDQGKVALCCLILGHAIVMLALLLVQTCSVCRENVASSSFCLSRGFCKAFKASCILTGTENIKRRFFTQLTEM